MRARTDIMVSLCAVAAYYHNVKQTDNSKLRGRQPVVRLLPLRQPAAAVAAADAAVTADSVHQLVLCVRDDSVELWEWRGQQESFIWSQDLLSTMKQQVCLLVTSTLLHT
jgi:hypothetical protein